MSLSARLGASLLKLKQIHERGITMVSENSQQERYLHISEIDSLFLLTLSLKRNRKIYAENM